MKRLVTPMSSTLTLPGLDCGLCGFRTCADLEARLATEPQLLKRCVHLSGNTVQGLQGAGGFEARAAREPAACSGPSCASCSPAASSCGRPDSRPLPWHDSLGREFDFYLEHFPEDLGPREVILPHNPVITRELDIQRGDLLLGRPLGLSCGCPITHCGVAVDVDRRTGVMTWCVTGPLGPREKGFKDLGFYSAQAYEGMIRDARVEIRIGGRYWFQPRMCMLQWRHSGLVNYLNRTPEGLQVRVEGLWIG